MIKHYNITVQGKVQGVSYRASAKQMALLLSVNGFVCNMANGDVYVETEGDEDLLTKFIQWCHHGPDNAYVKYVSVQEGAVTEFKGFEIQENK